MSVESISRVLNIGPDDRLSPLHRLVLIGIANHDGDGGSWPSMATLARYGGCSERTVQRHIAELVEWSFVERHINEGGNLRTRADRRPNFYVLTLDGYPQAGSTGRQYVSPREANGVTESADGVTEPAERGDTYCHPNRPEPSIEPSSLTTENAITDPNVFHRVLREVGLR
jgi:hypothetical protein